ncbi:8234_t:CDS:2 [Entrophospora sp. SA101]|nr:5210_t:CDS:2 [Entrophospora sp. SA101]CAJ0630781.1 5886_t:CDS:2 [Entrophospora sp. SA101]CAJ0758139.1 8234_t:CDS:2 [Entrophospora sp. SA101]CAJ0827123.1 7880_t:CDS:2 [Entrophospora sp. SA101]CAJ0837191.1 792_t:CDS:2 [Entrophospora sp. SA101]
MYSIPQHIDFIKNLTIDSVISEKQNKSRLIEIPTTATVEEAFDVLLAENILSVPVYKYFKGRKQPIAIISVLDLVSFICLQPIFENKEDNNDKNLNFENQYFLQKPVSEIVGLTSESTNLTMCRPENSLVDLLELLTRKRIHRVLVSKQYCDGGDNEEISSSPYFVSQTDVIRFLFNNNHKLGEILDLPACKAANQTIKLLLSSSTTTSKNQKQELLLSRPSSITIHDRALTAFKKIYQDGVSAVAVVNDDGSLVAEVSAADLRGLNRDRLNDLKKPVIMFLKSSKGALIKPLTCHRKFTLSQVMAGITLNKTHRAWFVDEDDIPIGVITLSDILSMFLPGVSDVFAHES